MRVAVYRNNHDVRVEERPRPSLGPGELLLRVEASGICGSDTMEWYRVPRAPVVLGHEVAGVVAEVGAGVTAFTPGDRVVATHHVPCGDCRWCRTDRESVCETLHCTSFDPGGFAEFVRLTPQHVARGVLRLPDHVTFEAGTFVEPLACVVRAQRLARLPPAASFAVLGAGVSGLLHVQVARANGAGFVLATDVDPERLRAAREFGADAAIDARDGTLAAEVLRSGNGGRRAECVVVCAGARAAFEQALGLVDRGGTIVFFAPLPPGESLALPVADLWRLGVTLMHSYAGPPGDMRTALELIVAARVDVSRMVTDRVALGETEEGFRRFVAGGSTLKVIVEPQR